jgi:hypothetical protein
VVVHTAAVAVVISRIMNFVQGAGLLYAWI